MKLTQRLIVVLGEASLINNDAIIKAIAGFHACTVIPTLSPAMLKCVFHFNRNAVFFSSAFDMSWKEFNPVFIQLTEGASDYDTDTISTVNLINGFRRVLDSKNIDVGDHASEDSTGMVEQSTSDCRLCQIYDRTSPQKEEIVYETKNFYVVPGAGSFVKGYFMVVPKEHIMSFALLKDDALKEFYQLLDDISSILKEIYGKGIFAFENGSGCNAAGKHKTSIVHAHFHLVATTMPILEKVQETGLYPQPIRKEELPNYKAYPYTVFRDQSGKWFIIPKEGDKTSCYIPRQYMRQLLGDYEKRPDNDWRKVFESPKQLEEDLKERALSAKNFRDYGRINFAYLPKRVQEAIVFDD